MPESLLLRWKCRRTVSTPVQLKPPLLTPSSLTSLSYPAISGAFIVGLGFFIFSVWVFLSFFPPLRANIFSPLTFGAYEQEELSLSMTPRGNFGGSSEKKNQAGEGVDFIWWWLAAPAERRAGATGARPHGEAAGTYPRVQLQTGIRWETGLGEVPPRNRETTLF